MAAKTGSQLERSISTIINVFHQYSRKYGHPDTLNKAEFKEMVNKDLPNFLKVRRGWQERKVQSAAV